MGASQHAETVDAVIETVATTVEEICDGLVERRGAAEEENPSGETKLAADVWADELLVERLTPIEGVCEVASEEREGVVDCGEGVCITLDPLDGSSNLASNNLMGTILGVYEGSLPAPGRDLVAAAYVLYGPTTTMVVARDEEVTEYLIDDGDATVVRTGVTLDDDPTVYGFGGRVPDWTPAFEAFADDVADELKLRYGGAFVGDVNQVLNYGGIFAYPALESHPEGKLRLQFEANPIAHIVHAAGGASSDGSRSLTQIEPTGLHQRTPVHVGSPELIERLEDALGAAHRGG